MPATFCIYILVYCITANIALVHATFRSKRRFGRLSLLQYLLSANSVRISYFYFVYRSLLYYFRYFCMMPHGVINDDYL